MTVYLLCFTAWGQSLIEKCEQAHRALAASEVELIIQGAEDWTYRLEFQRPNYARFVIVKKLEKNPSEEVLVGEKKALLLNHTLRQYRVIPFKNGLGLGSRFELAAPSAPILLRPLLEPEGINSLLRNSGAWRESPQGSIRMASSQGMKIWFDSSNKLSSLEASHGKQAPLKQFLTYSRLRKVYSLSAPAHYYLVNSFNSRISPPSYADEASLKVLDRSLRFYSGLDQAHYLVESGRQKREIFLNKRKASERSAHLSWAYNDKQLRILDHKNRRVYQGSVSKSKVVTALGKLGWAVDPTLSYLWRGRNPIHYYLNKDMRLNQAGSIVLNSANCSILHATRKGQKISLVARASDGALLRLSADTLDSFGRKLSSTDRLFEYKSIRRPLGSSVFTLKAPKGYQVKPLSNLIRS